ncbi:hypothetical protein AWZ03_001558 [Drosophila navojoa]|uniref:Uncharacterized protein n=1 Tax=Drosophila navojoa TaxID=7232 RepID=A0A484BSX7_DRONA|nr:hypothetical protein AWZ03_001558 [Drosophila navojoa]
MAATYIILLSCLVYGAMAGGAAPSKLSPVEGRPVAQGVGVAPLRPAPAASRPSNAYLPPAKGAVRSPVASAPLNLAPGAQRPIDNRAPVNVGGKRLPADRPVVAAQSVNRQTVIGAPVVGGKRQVIQRPIASAPRLSAPLKQRSPYGGAVRRGPIVGAARPISPIRQKLGSDIVGSRVVGSRTVGSKAPY